MFVCSSPVDDMSDGGEVVAHVQSGDVTHVWQRQEELKSLLTVTSDLQRYSDSLTFSLLHLSQFSQYDSRFIWTSADHQSHAGAHQRCQRPVIITTALDRPGRLT